MRRILLALVLVLFLAPLVVGQSVNLSWQAPTTNEDGTPLTDLAGYRLYASATSGGPYLDVTDVGNVLSSVWENQAWEGQTIYFVATAYDDKGNESAYSNEVSRDFPMVAPNPPVLQP